VKAALWDGRISTTVSFFKQELSNQAIFGGNLPNGVSFQLPIGSTTQKGVDGDLAIAPLPGLEFILTGYVGEVNDQSGTQVSGSYTSAVSLFSHYEFPQGPLSGLAIGGGFVTIGGRTVATGGPTGIFNIPGGVPPFIKVDGGHLVNLFASYKFRKDWMFRINVNNVLDDYYPLGLQGPIAADPSPPRTFTFSATYRF
jgi:outer membrane receptor protein involved in Fe transport